MAKFKVGDRVEVTDGEKARDTGAKVQFGEQGTITDIFNEGFPDVDIDNSWSIPQDGLKLLEGE